MNTAVEILRSFLLENGLASRTYAYHDHTGTTWFLKVDTLLNVLCFHVKDSRIMVRKGSLGIDGHDIVINGTLCDNTALDNFLRLVKFCRFGIDETFKEVTNFKPLYEEEDND